MAKIDDLMKNLYTDILNKGYLRDPDNQYYADGTQARRQSLFGGTLRIEPEDGLAFVTSKYVPPKSATAEVLGFYQHYTNSVEELQSLGTKVWDEWGATGSIGRSYGYQIGKQLYKVKDVSRETLEVIKSSYYISNDPNFNYMLFVHSTGDVSYYNKIYLNQMEYVIWQIIDKPESTRILTDIWTIFDIEYMALPPCVFFTQWVVMGDRLNLLIKPRSSDAFLGLPFNVAQFHVLLHLVSHVTNKKVGTFEVQMSDVHLYDRHFEQAKQFIANPTYSSPKIWIDPSVKHWGDFKYGINFGIKDYEHAGTIKAEITVNQKELEEKNMSF